MGDVGGLGPSNANTEAAAGQLQAHLDPSRKCWVQKPIQQLKPRWQGQDGPDLLERRLRRPLPSQSHGHSEAIHASGQQERAFNTKGNREGCTAGRIRQALMLHPQLLLAVASFPRHFLAASSTITTIIVAIIAIAVNAFRTNDASLNQLRKTDSLPLVAADHGCQKTPPLRDQHGHLHCCLCHRRRKEQH